MNFLVYCGKGMFADNDINEDMPSTKRIPSVLMEKFLGKGHVFHTDNYYTSTILVKYFLSNNTHICGTIHSSQYDFLKDVINKVLEHGDAVFYLSASCL